MSKRTFTLSCLWKKLSGLIIFVLYLKIAACTLSNNNQTDPESQYLKYCGNCHLAPKPSQLPKSIWEENVLPEMAARLGYKYNGYNPLRKNTMEENLYIRLSQTYPESPGIDSISWQQIHDYIIAMAPETVPIDSLRSQRNGEMSQFEAKSLRLGKHELAMTTSILFNEVKHQFYIGNAYGEVFNLPESQGISVRFGSPVMSIIQKTESTYVTEVGYMNPSEKPLGTIYSMKPNSIDTLARKLHRPVFTEIADLNEDGQEEILICEFGNLTGELSLLTASDTGFVKRTLLPVPGTIKVEIADMDQDGKKDIIVLASQGNEGIFILCQTADLQFGVKQVIKLAPEYGSSWFELIDYNKDKHLDIVLANGDNADYSIFPKPYHGLRVFLNDGKNGFEEKWFYPIYGATRVLAEDYDQDGDLDFAVMAFFPEYDHTPLESFVFLENQDPEKFLFKSYTTPESHSGRWMVMEKGDYDQDGDTDILLGSFLLPLERKYMPIMDLWREDGADLLLLENKLKD